MALAPSLEVFPFIFQENNKRLTPSAFVLTKPTSVMTSVLMHTVSSNKTETAEVT